MFAFVIIFATSTKPLLVLMPGLVKMNIGQFSL